MSIETELLEKVLGLEADSIESANIPENDNTVVRYYLCSEGYDYPKYISIEDLKFICILKNISYDVLIKINDDIEVIEESMINVFNTKLDHTMFNGCKKILDTSALDTDKIRYKLNTFINSFKNIEYKDDILKIETRTYYRDRENKILYNEDGTKASYGTILNISIPEGVIGFRTKEEYALDLLANKLFYLAINKK